MSSGGVTTSPSCTRLFCREQSHFFFACGEAEWFSSSSPAAGLGRAIFSAFLFGAIHLGSLDQQVAQSSSTSSTSSTSDRPGCAAAPTSLSAGVMSARRPTGAGWGSFSSMKFDSHRCLLGGSGASGASGSGTGASDGGESGACPVRVRSASGHGAGDQNVY